MGKIRRKFEVAFKRTYIRIKTCFVYLAVILDLFSRKVIGWAISRRIDRNLCLEALRMALHSSLGYLSPAMFENRVTGQNNNSQTESAPLF